MRKYIIATLLLCVSQILFAQTKTGSLAGIVMTSDQQPAPDVTISLRNSTRGAVSSPDGSFEIKRLAPGSYIAEISLMGYAPLSKEVIIAEGQRQLVRFSLDLSASELEAVVVSSGGNAYTSSQPSSSLRVLTPLLKLPQNIQVVNGNTLRDQQVFDMSEGVTRNVSGASQGINESWGNYANIVMRGGAVTAFRNGMNVKLPWGPLLEDMSVVDRIEFVKGPAGFMLANGEPTGLYNIVTKKPLETTQGEAGLTMGSFNTYRATLDLTGRVKPESKLLYRINVMGQMMNSHRDFDYNNRYTIAPALTYQFNSGTSLTAEYTWQHMKIPMLGSGYVFSPKLGDLPASSSILEPNLAPTAMNEQSLFLTFNHELNDRWKLTGKMAFLRYDQEGASIWPDYPAGLQPNGDLMRSIANWDAFSSARLGQVFVNGTVRTGRVSHQLLGGIDLSYKNYYADFYQYFPLGGFDAYGSPLTFNIYQPVHGMVPPDAQPKFDRSLPLRQRGFGTLGESSSSLYIQDEIGLMEERLGITLAGRHTTIEQHSFGTYSKDSEFTPRAGVSFSIDRTTSVYGLYDQSFVAQQGADSARRPFVPVTGHQLELGVKNESMGGRLQSTFSAYRIIRNNVISYVPGPQYRPIQTGQTLTRGIEVDVKGRLCNSLSLIGNYAFTEAEVTRDEDPSKIGGTVPGAGFPKHTHNLWLNWNTPKAQGFGAALGYQFLTARQNNQPDYFRLDGNLHWENRQFRISLNARNILDRYLISGAPYEFNNDYSSPEYYFQIEPGINFRLAMSYRF